MLRFESDVLSETSEIVIRDKNGEFEVGDPPTPPLDEAEEEAALDDAQENERTLRIIARSLARPFFFSKEEFLDRSFAYDDVYI